MRGKEDETLRQKNALLEGINRIFKKALACRTEEEVGGICLAVAEDVTASKFGFVGELGADGRLHYIAISNPGWSACRMADPTGHGIVPNVFEVHGLYGRVVRNGNGFYTNDPASQPDFIGVPEGHPSLEAFLGVPLTHAGHIIGMVGVGNRPGGYRDADLEGLELLAPAIVQALLSKRADEALRKSEHRYRDLVQNANSAIIRWRGDGTITFFNEYAQAFFGYSAAEAVGQQVGILLPPQELSGTDLTGLARNILDNPQDYVNNINENVCRDGRRVWMTWTNRAITDQHGRVAEILAVGSDITEQKRTEQALRESEHRWAVTLSSIGDAVIATDMHGQVTFMNKVAEALTGWQRADALGRPVVEVFRIVDEQTRTVAENPVDKVRHSGKIVGLADHTVLLRKGGGEVHIDDSGAPIRDDAGRTLGVVLIFRDIGVRRRVEKQLLDSERRYRGLFQSMEAFSVFEPVLDAQGRTVDFRYLEVNEAGARLRDRKPEALRGRTILKMFPALDRYWIDAYRKVLQTGQPMRFDRFNPVTKRWYQTYAYCPEKGQIASLILDITDRKQAEKALQELTASLEQQVAERTDLAKSRARQLQTLAVELIEAEERERRRVAELLHDDLQQILAAAKMQLQAVCDTLPPDPMLGNVGQLLEESIGKSRRLSHELSPAVLHHSGLPVALSWLTRQMGEQFGLDVELETSAQRQFENTPFKVFLFRAVQELLFNITKHAGVKKARIKLYNTDDDLHIEVSDQGQGFDPETLNGSTDQSGFGLLSLRERASYIGGGLTIESGPGQGSRFTLSVPRGLGQPEAPRPRVPAPEGPPRTPAAASSADKGMRVLFVDDHKVMRQGLIQLINGQPDIQVVGEAANGREALEKTRRLQPAVVVMDVAMPVMDGVEATRRIKAEFPDVRVIGLSMFEDEHIARTMHDAGAEAFVSKTASSAELLKAIYGMEAHQAPASKAAVRRCDKC